VTGWASAFSHSGQLCDRSRGLEIAVRGQQADEGFLRVDVRAQVETHDGAFIYVQYLGPLEMNDTVQRATRTGAGTAYGDQYFFTNPRMETGDARYAWVNTTFFVGEGRLIPGLGVEYRAWRPVEDR